MNEQPVPMDQNPAQFEAGSASGALTPYDAVVLVSFGGPEKPDDVLPFLENVTRGRGIPRERLAQVGEHYYLFGGRSPINDQCRSLLAALRTEFRRRGYRQPLYWGNRNWTPYLTDELAQVAADGHRRVLAVTTSAYPSYSSCRQYRENLYDAAAPTPLQIDRIRHYAHHPGFITASVDATVAALDELGAAADTARLIFVTHSVPTAMAESSGPPPRTDTGAYVDWHRAVAAEVSRQVNERRRHAGTTSDLEHDLTYCSRSGPPSQPWTTPDVNDHLAEVHQAGASGVVLIPIGFVSDHMEVIYDLDTEAAETAAELGLPMARAATAGVHPAFVAALVDLMEERAAAARGEDVDQPVMAGGTVSHYRCPAVCCPNLGAPDRPALCQQEPVPV